MTMQSARVIIIGGGLSGVHAAYMLEKRGITDYLLLEAQSTFGGRIATASTFGLLTAGAPPSINPNDRFDLGPTWFWPDYQQQLRKLISELGLEQFPQYEDGDMIVERSSNPTPIRTRGYVSAPSSMRLIGGMSSLIDALLKDIPENRLVLDQQVNHIRIINGRIEVDARNTSGQLSTYTAQQVMLAVPPRLAAKLIEFTPSLPEQFAEDWRNTATWMAPHAKYVAIYDQPFWRDKGLSGEGRSDRGPLVEIHDASMPDGRAALFGFIGVPAQTRKAVDDEILRTHCQAQLVRMFGNEAATPLTQVIKDWAADPLTATEADLHGGQLHGRAPASTPKSGEWHRRIIGIASEWSPQFPGYVAGAIEASGLGIQLLNTTSTPGLEQVS
ncbi:FAD-dependent oxidoreductase [Pseudomonas atacamensis]|uniref:FAD-dependent oxidoreductase n=1 Tax=Pseudomonas atacamensis TaxID=2565368 RepID=A0AAQ2D744_9PSED|nr:FAD-dependent oxidoreductase [Pseudomonas atacamensis]THF25803.1 FAD-dependent oxidoreductase [Pseudomonas atacamensis]